MNLCDKCNLVHPEGRCPAEAQERIAELEVDRDKWKKMFELRGHAVDRWCPCSDHRDKVAPDYCPVCSIEKAEAENARLSKLADVSIEANVEAHGLRSALERAEASRDSLALAIWRHECSEDDLPKAAELLAQRDAARADCAAKTDLLMTIASMLELPRSEDSPPDDPLLYENEIASLDTLYKEAEGRGKEHADARWKAEADCAAMRGPLVYYAVTEKVYARNPVWVCDICEASNAERGMVEHKHFCALSTDGGKLLARMSELEQQLIHHAVHEEYDCPGDMPEPVGWACLICGGYGDEQITVEHERSCVLAALDGFHDCGKCGARIDESKPFIQCANGRDCPEGDGKTIGDRLDGDKLLDVVNAARTLMSEDELPSNVEALIDALKALDGGTG